MTMFTGLGVALITPLKDNKVDFDAMRQLIERQIAAGTDAIVIFGTTGEPSTMADAERYAVMDFAKEVIGTRAQLIIGSGGNCTLEVIEYSLRAKKAGADALLIVTPYYNKATQNGLYAHYSEIHKNVDLPIIAYNVPSRTGCNLMPKTVLRLAQDGIIAAVKESCGNIDQITELCSLVKGILPVFSGDDGIITPMIALGAQGVISVAANIIPEKVKTLTMSALNGDFATAREIQFEINNLINLLFCEVNPIPIKTACGIMGLCNIEFRLPLSFMEESNKILMTKEMQRLNII